MFKVLITKNHTQDTVWRNQFEPMYFGSKEKAQAWIDRHAEDGAEYKVAPVKLAKMKPKHRKSRKRNRVKMVSLDAIFSI